MKKITFLADATNAHMERWIFALQDDFEIQIVTPAINSHLDSKIHQVLYKQNPARIFPFRQLALIWEIYTVKKQIRKFLPDILHAHYAVSHPIVHALPKEIPFVTSLWGSDIVPLPGQFITDKFLKYLKIYVARSQKITAVSPYLAHVFEKLFPKSSVKAEIIPFGVDTSLFIPAPHEVTTPVVVGFARAFFSHYGFLDLLRAAAPLLKEGLIKLKVAGSGTEEMFYKAESERLGVSARVEFIGRVSPVTKMPEFYQSLDIFASPSHRESFGVAALEAQACGLPVVATTVGGLRETIQDGVTGILVPKGDIEAIRVALKKLATDSDLRKRMGEAGRKNVQANYEWKNNVAQMKALYESLAK